MKFKEVSSTPDFLEIEKKILQFWKKNKILEEYLHKNEKSVRRFSFLDGPITANNPMGVHHAWGRTLKDLYQRYKNMQGFKQRFQNGFDNQGLWVEVEVEKKLGFKSKKDIEKYGIGKFVEKCKEHTLHFAKVQTEQSKRLGYFMDWGNDYYTMSDENNYAIWHFLKKCWEKSWLYKGEDVVPWCPRCGTAISQHEILTSEYADVTHKAVYLKYPLKGRKNEFLLVWTTTPWTLLANVAIAANPEIKYVKIKTQNGEVLILAKARLRVIDQDYKVLEEFLGKKLSGLKYEGLYDDLPIVKKAVKEHPVVSWKEGVLKEEGTGLVHVSPGSGPEDYDLAKEINLPIFPVLDESGIYIKGYGVFEGKKAQEIANTILNDLEKKKLVYKIEDFTHRYPLCWRCKTELLFRLVDEWYISMDELRYRMMEVAKKIRWIPEFGLKMELDWLKNMEDWLISKKRYWGLCLPIWECECGHFEVIGSKEELQEKAIKGWDEFEGHTPHRPWVDEVKIRCSKCDKIISRIPDVGNPWLDAGIVSFSTLKYFEDKEYWKKWFPADLVLECFPGQFKNWFYSLIAMATVLEDNNPFKTLLGHNLVRDEHGREMHKSWGNTIEFNEAAEKMGADVMRWMYARQNPTIALNFGYGPAQDIKKRILFIFWNCYKFFLDYASVDFQSIEELEKIEKEKSQNILDSWILSRLNGVVRIVEERLDDYDHSTAARVIEDFIVNDFSTWYIRRSRNRIGPRAPTEKDKEACYATFYKVLLTLIKLLAPFMPFLTEQIWQNLKGRDSVHLQDWPSFEESLIDKKLEEEIDLIRKICSLGHAARKKVRIKVRQPFSELQITNYKLRKELVDLIKDELNVKDIKLVKAIKAEKNLVVEKENDLEIALNTRITPELKEEGMVREVVRQIQGMRKKAGYKPRHRILIQCSGTDFLNKILEKNKEFILRRTIAEEFQLGKRPKQVFDVERDMKIEGQNLWLAIKKL